ncbi:MAG: CoA transferase [Bacillota bacterium]|nr:CoA transferase [Bacillota bacterium]
MSFTNEENWMLGAFRALDLTNENGFLCGKILGDLGADVIKVEKPGGDQARNFGPFFKDQPDNEKSLYWFAYNNNKRGITLNLEEKTGRDIFCRLVKTADFVIESFPPGYLEGLGLGYEQLKQINPQVILTSISPFGQTGPYSHYQASDLITMAMCGMMSLAGYPDRPPIRVSVPQSYMWTGMQAAAGTLLAHYYRGSTGKGQHVDVSAQASMLCTLAHAPTFWDVNRVIPTREGPIMSGRSVTGAKMRTIYECKDGYINFIVYGGPAGRITNKALTEWMNEEDMATDYLKNKDWSTFDIATVTQEDIDQIESPAAKFFKTKTKKEFFKEAIKRRMLGYPVATAEEIFEDPQLTAREYWQKVEHPELGTEITYPGGFCKFSDASCGIRRRAPLIGEHNEEIFEELGFNNEDLRIMKQSGII